jgi:flagellar biogenesis protein FliO
MDRRLPTVSKHVSRASVVSVAVWSHALVAWGAGEAEGRAIPMPGGSDASMASGGGWLSMLVAVAGLGVAGWLWWRRARGAGRGNGRAIAVIDRTSMGGGRSLALVRVGDRVVLVGESAQGFQRLAEFEADEAAAHEAANPQAKPDVARRLAS